MPLKTVKKVKGKLLRVLDANYNRAKEGLRVCEDICRFCLNDCRATRKYKNARHALSLAMAHLKILDLIEARDTSGDVGKGSSKTEISRRGIHDIFYANSQRVKESIRVLEEFAKLLNPRPAQELKKLRYEVYILEHQVIKTF